MQWAALAAHCNPEAARKVFCAADPGANRNTALRVSEGQGSSGWLSDRERSGEPRAAQWQEIRIPHLGEAEHGHIEENSEIEFRLLAGLLPSVLECFLEERHQMRVKARTVMKKTFEIPTLTMNGVGPAP